MLKQSELDCVLSYNQYTLQNTRFADETIPMLKQRGVGVMNGGPFSARLLTNSKLPVWFRDPVEVQAAARRAAKHCESKGVDIAQLALQFCLLNEDISTTVAVVPIPRTFASGPSGRRCPSIKSYLAKS